MPGRRQVEQSATFYRCSFGLHAYTDNLLCSIDRFVDLIGLRQEPTTFYASTARPSTDPEFMISRRIINDYLGIRTARRPRDQIRLSLAYLWFYRLGPDGRGPDHPICSKTRHRRFRISRLLRRLFETMLDRCIADRFAGSEVFADYGSLTNADANPQREASLQYVAS